MDSLRIFVGFDSREAVAYHVFCQSVIERASIPVSFHPLHGPMLSQFDGQRDGTNAFTFSRYLVPYLCAFNGWALFMDGDMVVDTDIAAIQEYQRLHYNKALSVVKHDYRTRHARKYIGSKLENKNLDYPRKNWSSVILWNCSHFSNRVLVPDYVQDCPPSFLHRLGWVADKDIGELPTDWNHLVGEYPPAGPNVYHYTLGVPGLKHYADDTGSWKWHVCLRNALECAGEIPSEMVKRAEERVG